MRERLEQIEISKMEKAKPDTEAENIRAEIIRIDNEMRGLMDRVAQADDVLFNLINEKVKTLHATKSDLDEKLRARARKQKEVDTAPLLEPLSRWDCLTVEEKNELAKTMIEVVYLSDIAENSIDIVFSI
jgi:hypothetical protein